MKKSKQVIIVRTDLRNSNGHKIRTGKLIAQAAHASLAALFNTGGITEKNLTIPLPNKSAINDWVNGSFTKICVSVDSEAELIEVYQAAVKAKLICALITDAGLTEFNGVPTKTCCAIGPEWSDEIDKITGKLKLL
jgi:PTH2 family peptidyl-tRNA hydrolase